MKKTALYAALSALIAMNAQANMANNELDYASTKDIRDINPHLYGGEMAAQNMVFESLVLDTEQGVKPHLAESWTISKDGKTYTFKLRQGVKFTDGEPFNAQAVKLNMDAVIANYQRHAWLELVREIDAVNVIDDYTVELKLKHAYYPTLIELGLTRPFRFISPKAFIDGKTQNGVSNYAGTGPWVLTEHKNNQFARFERNKNYWGNAPHLNAVVWNVIPDRQTMLLALQKGDIQLIFGADGDMLGMDAFKAFENSGILKTAMSNPIASRSIVLNSAQPITADKTVRQALQHAVDKQAIVSGVLNNSETLAETLMAKDVPYANVPQTTYKFDPQLAKQLLDNAGWKFNSTSKLREKEGKPLHLLLSYNVKNAAEKEIAELLQDNFKAVGIELEILGEEKQAFLDRQKSGKFDLQYSLSWGKPYDPASFVSSFRIPAHADYQGQKGLPNKAEIDQMVSDLLITPDENQRKQLYAKLFQTLADEAVYIPISYSRTKAVFSKDVKGVTFNESQYEIPFEKMRFEK